MYALAKRILDVIVASVALLLLAPVMLLVAVLVLVFLGRPILFRQARPGLHGAPFTLIKFRSMAPTLPAGAGHRADSERMGRFGAALRSSSLDELPSLVNVLRGHMSLVGPRPLLMDYLPLYSPRQALRHQVPPGLTGWAQVNGRNAIEWREKLELDVWYVQNRSFRLDLFIIWRTLWKVVTREGVSAEGHVTVERFTGASSDD